MWYVYILECESGALYTGVATDVLRRFKEHRRHTAHYTSYNPPLRIVYTEPCSSRSAACQREARIKGWTRAEKLALVSSHRAVLKRREADRPQAIGTSEGSPLVRS